MISHVISGQMVWHGQKDLWYKMPVLLSYKLSYFFAWYTGYLEAGRFRDISLVIFNDVIWSVKEN